MTYNDLQWPTMIYNDLQWPTMTYNDRTRGPENTLKVLVKETEVPTEKYSSRTSIVATKASYISN